MEYWSTTNRYNQEEGPTVWPMVGYYEKISEYVEDYALALEYDRRNNLKEIE